MKSTDIIRQTWWLFAIDAAIYVISASMFSPSSSEFDSAHNVFLILSLIAASIAAFFVARQSGKVSTAIKLGAIFWFIWRPILFVAFAALLTVTGSLDFKYAMISALGYVLAQLLVSPIVFILCGCAGWLGSKLKPEKDTDV